MSIPKNITEIHIDKAISEIKLLDIPKKRLSNTYFLLSNNKKLPPKYVLSQANIYANKEELDGGLFNAVEAVAFLRKRGYIIEEIDKIANIKLYDIHGKSTIENFRTFV